MTTERRARRDKWAGVVRVSHMGGRASGAADFHSERDQIAAMREAVTKDGGTLEVLPSELDVSGGLPIEERPSLLAAVEGVESGRYVGIVVAFQSRLGREMEQEEAVWRRVEAAGGQIIMALDGLDTSTVDGKMVRRIRSAINTREREAHAEKFEDLRKWATENGIWQRRQTPLGYDRDPTSRKLVPNVVARNVQRAFRDRAKGVSLVQIADRLSMTPSGVRYLLRNRVYVGELRVGKHVNPDAHPPLVTIPEFQAAQRTIARPPRVNREPALLAGLLRCGSCGHVMTRGAGAKGHPAYMCPRNHSGGRCPAPTAITVALVDAHVAAIARAELGRLAVTSSSGKGVKRARAALADAEHELTAYLGAVSAAGIGQDAFAEGARQRKEAVDAAREELDAELGVHAVAPTIAGGADAWDTLNGHERNVLLRALMSAVIVRRVGRGARVPVADRVRVLAHGADVRLPEGRGKAHGIIPVPLPDLDHPGVLRVASGEDALEGAGGVGEMSVTAKPA